METVKHRPVEASNVPGGFAATLRAPVARGPLLRVHREAGASVSRVHGWEVATRYPTEPRPDGNALVDLSHWLTFEINGPQTGDLLGSVYGVDVPLRRTQVVGGCQIYRLTDRRAMIFCPDGPVRAPSSGLDVTGGWASIALIGPDAGTILSKVTAVDLRRETLPPMTCCQGPLFGVNTLFGRFENRFELHVCSDSAEFFWEVLLDAGQEFALTPAGLEFYQGAVQVG